MNPHLTENHCKNHKLYRNHTFCLLSPNMLKFRAIFLSLIIVGAVFLHALAGISFTIAFSCLPSFRQSFPPSVCVCFRAFARAAVQLTWLLVDISCEQPISCLLGIWSGEIELPKVGHVKDSHAVSAREALALDLHGKTHCTYSKGALDTKWFEVDVT